MRSLVLGSLLLVAACGGSVVSTATPESSEVLFLSNPDDLAFMRRADAIDVIAKAFVEG